MLDGGGVSAGLPGGVSLPTAMETAPGGPCEQFRIGDAPSPDLPQSGNIGAEEPGIVPEGAVVRARLRQGGQCEAQGSRGG